MAAIKTLIKRIVKPFIPYGLATLYFTKNHHNTPKLLRFEVHVTEHCNLNCIGCFHFSSLAHEEYLDPISFEKDCERISQLTHKLRECRILGGEPLLHPELTKFFDIARKYFRNSPINIVTNGILILKQPESFWESCRKNNIEIIVTKYPINLDFDAMEELAYSKSVFYRYSDDLPVKTMSKSPLDIKGNNNAKNSFMRCFWARGGCTTLRDGRIYPCCITAHLKYFTQEFGELFQVSDNDSIDIYKAYSIQEIQDFLEHPIPFCRYCNIKSMKSGIEWGVTKRELSEWL